MTSETSRVPLVEIRTVILAALPPGLLDAHQTWIYLPLLRLRSAQWECVRFAREEWGDLLPTARFDRRLLRRAQQFLAPLSETPGCRILRRGNRWTNPSYCPPTPFGAYLWPFTCWMVQEALWLYPEFIAGHEWWLAPGDRGRDANPYRDGDRAQSWDKGYILGQAEHYHPGRVRQWIESLKAPEPAPEGQAS